MEAFFAWLAALFFFIKLGFGAIVLILIASKVFGGSGSDVVESSPDYSPAKPWPSRRTNVCARCGIRPMAYRVDGFPCCSFCRVSGY